MELFDSHFHYYGESTPAEFMRMVDTELQVPPQSDVGNVTRLRVAAVGGDYLESIRAREFAQVVPGAVFAVGVHPHQAAAFRAEPADFSEFRDHQQLAAVGELGLDYFYEQSEREVQRSVFAEFLELALQWRRPAIVHIRDKEESSAAYEDAEALLRDFSAAGGSFVVHCFAGTPAEAETFLAMGGYLGATGMVTFRRAENIREVLKLIPDERLLIETDSPYLAPVPHRGAQNHPGYLGLIAARVAEVRGCSTPELAALTFQNACRFFHCEER